MRPLDKEEEQRLEIRSKQYQSIFVNVVNEKNMKSLTVRSIGETQGGGKERKCTGKAVLS